MIFYDRLFATYYFWCLKLRKINKTRIEDFQAMCLVLCSQILVIGIFLTSLQNSSFIPHINIPKPITIIALLIMIYFEYKYFLSDRKRKNRIIDNYRELPFLKKTVWKIVSAGLILIPLLVIIFIL
jgi:hypothetical protein